MNQSVMVQGISYKNYIIIFFFKFQVTGPIIVKRMNTSNGTVYYQQPAAASNSSAASANCRDPSRNPASSDSISSKNFKVSKGGIQNETALVGAECFATSNLSICRAIVFNISSTKTPLLDCANNDFGLF